MSERQIFKNVDGRIVAELQSQLDAANARIAELEATSGPARLWTFPGPRHARGSTQNGGG